MSTGKVSSHGVADMITSSYRLLPLLFPTVLLTVWWLATSAVFEASPMAAHFSPEETWRAARELAVSDTLGTHTFASLKRVLFGLGLALMIGIPIGLLVGVSRGFERGTTPTFQFLRMMSPLSLMPLAVMVFGIGDAPVCFLVAFATVWPIMLNVASGVGSIDSRWMRLSRSLAASRSEVLFGIIIPAIVGHLLVGVRLAIGLAWIVLVPAEMLGVQAGLGYLILDTRDRMAYGELLAVILYIGMFGYLLDHGARWVHRRWQHRN